MNRVLTFAFLVLPGLAYALDITRHGITWTITGSPTSGTYANGDPWVVGPVEITAISPAPGSGRNGWMTNINGSSTQGFDNRIQQHTYSAPLALPQTFSTNISIVSATSAASSQTFGQVTTYAVLTVVTAAPPTGAFRPAYFGTASKHSSFTTNNLDYTKLNSLDRSALSGVPTLASLTNIFQYVQFEKTLSWIGRYIHGQNNWPNSYGPTSYGQALARGSGAAALSLNLDYTDTQKETLLIQVVQHGIDIAGIIAAGGSWSADGGHNCGRLSPLIVAAVVLEDATMQGYLNGTTSKRFQEYQQTFYVAQSDVDTARYTADGRPRTAYSAGDIGKPEWGEKHTASPNRDGDNWDAYYRDIAGGVAQAPAVLAQVMGARALCNWEPFFKYAQRHIYYRESRYASAVYYNGYDDGVAYGTIHSGSGAATGNNSSAPFGFNETTTFDRSFFLTYEFADPPESGPDNSPPVISNLSSNVTDTTATITWTTDDASSTWVEWGPTASYGTAKSNLTLVTSHSIQITGLTPETLYHWRVACTNGSAVGTNSSDYTFTTLADQPDVVDTPSITTGGRYAGILTVTITCGTAGANIYYTTNGVDPTTNDTLYSGAFALTQPRTVKAIGVKATFTDSAVAASTFEINNFTSIDEWRNATIVPSAYTGTFRWKWYATPNTNNMDAVTGLSDGAADAYTDLAVILRFNISGTVDARNGGSYTAVNTLNYTNGVEHLIDITADVSSHTYSATVTPDGVAATVIATDYAFRTEQSSVAELDNVALLTTQQQGPDDALEVANMEFPGAGVPGTVRRGQLHRAGGRGGLFR